jgi:Ca2+-binding EF-hand superfamily protein
MRLPLIVSSLFALTTLAVHAGQDPKSFHKRFNRLDLNGDAVVDAGEFAKLLPAKLTKNHALVQLQTEMFAWFDEDTNAVIDPVEWRKAMPRVNAESPAFSDVAADELDTNGDGKLTWKEFNRVIHFYVSAKTARRWLHELKFSSTGLSGNERNRTVSTTEPSSAGVEILPAGPMEWAITSGGDCLGPSE